MAEWRSTRDRPRRIRLQPDAPFRGVGLFAVGGVMLSLFLLAVLGWLGVVAIARDFWGLFATPAIGALYIG